MKKARLLSSIGEHRATFYLDYLVSEVFSTSASIQILLRHLTGRFLVIWSHSFGGKAVLILCFLIPYLNSL